jgi:hypothetical protein
VNHQIGKPPSIVAWWIIWAVIIAGLTALYFTLGQRPSSTPGDVIVLRYLPLAPLALAVAVRWLILPRFTECLRAFPIFIVGLALAEGCGILGIFLVPDLAATYYVLALFGLLQFAPFFAARYPA